MTLTKLLADNRITGEPSSKQELDELRQMVATNLSDVAVTGLSSQGRYEFAYNAGRLIATIAIRAGGYRVTAKVGHHYFTFQALEAVDPGEFATIAAFLDTARSKRNDFSYDAPITVSDTDADELVTEVKQFHVRVEQWIAVRDPSLL